MNTLVQYGINLGWGLGATAVTITGATGIFQDIEYNLKLDELETRDQRGTVATWTGYNPSEMATFNYFLSDANAASGSAVPTLNANVPDRSTKVTVTSVGPMSGSSWIVQDVLVRETNTDNMKVTVKATRYVNIT